MVGSNSFKSLAAPEELWGNTITDMEDIEHNPKRYALDMLRIFLASGVPVVLHGPPGASKTETIKSLRRYKDELGNNFLVRVVQPSTEDPMDIHGLKVITRDENGETTTQRSMPQIVKDIVEGYKRGQKTILLLDEMSTALLSQQHALLGLVQSGVFGDVDISPMTAIAMASNPQGTVDVSRDLDKQFLNRAGHIPWVSQADEWMENWKSGFGDESNAPPRNIEREMEGLFEEGGDKVFRSLDNSWSFNELVPYDRLELSERTAYLYTLVSRTIDESTGPMVSANMEIRWRYKLDAAIALWGKEWGQKMGRVLSKEQDQVVDYGYLIEAVTGAGIHSGSDLDDVVSALNDTLKPGGQRLSSEHIKDLFDPMVEKLLNGFKQGTVDGAAMLSMWALISSATEQERGLMDRPSIMMVYLSAKRAAASGEIDDKEVMPDFVPEEVRGMLKDMASLED